MDGIAPFLPQEIITYILKFLPVKSLIRFQCVCKHWKNLIKSSSFIAAHLHNSTQHRPCLLFQRFLIRDCLQLCLLDCEKQIVQVQNIPEVCGRAWIVGSSNGVLCIRLDRYGNRISPLPSLLLWNPTFGEVRSVPTTSPEYSDCYMGFGFSPIAKDYKIVRLHCLKYRVHLAEVYSLGIGSWKEIEVENLRGLILSGPAGFTMNGAIFWIGFKPDMGEGREYAVVSFDIATEAFALIPVPALHVIYGIHVTEFEHRVALLCSTLIGNSESCLIELFVLEEGTGSWAKKCTSNPYPSLLRPVTIWRNEIASVDEAPERVKRPVLSNFTGTELKVLFGHRHFIFSYVESLVSVSNI